MYVNVGVKIDGERPKSKKALMEAVKACQAGPDRAPIVVFDETSLVGAGRKGIRTLGDLVTACESGTVILSVAGPDPYTSRKWFANVTVGYDKAGLRVIKVS